MKRIFILCITLAFGWTHAWKPQEPIGKVLIIMAAGINPNTGDLYKSTPASRKNHKGDLPCSDESGHAHIFRSYGVTSFLEKNVARSINELHAQAFPDASGSPIEEVPWLASRTFSLDRECDGDRTTFVAKDGKVIWGVEASTGVHNYTVKSFFEQAVIRWYEGELLKFQSNDKSGDPDVFKWIGDFKIAKGIYPSLTDMRAGSRELVPSRYIIIAHSMGGNTTREYVHSPIYAGDVDKLITLDTPHEGSYLVDINKEIVDHDALAIKIVSQDIAQFALGGLILYLSNNKVGDDIGWGIIISTALTSLIEPIAKVTFANTLCMGYGYSNGANSYLSPSNPDQTIQKLNNDVTVGNGFRHPAYRIFHNEGLVSPGNPSLLIGNAEGPFGLLYPKAFEGLLATTFHSGVQDYVRTPNEQKFSNAILAGLMGGAAQLNFSNQGTIAVNASSSKGNAVKAFQLPDADLKRYLFSLDGSAIVPGSFEELPGALPSLLFKGWIESVLANAALNSLSVPQPWVKWLKWPASMAMAYVLESKAGKGQRETIGKNDQVTAANAKSWTDFLSLDFLKDFSPMPTTHDYSTVHSTDKLETRSIKDPLGNTISNDVSFLEDALWEKPYANMSSVASSDNISLNLGIVAGGKSIYQVKQSDIVSPNNEIDFTKFNWQERIGVKSDEWGKAPGSTIDVRHPKTYFLPPSPLVTTMPDEFQFVVDDLRPDLMPLFSIDFNYGKFVLTWKLNSTTGKYDVIRQAFGEAGPTTILTGVASPIDFKGNWKVSLLADKILAQGRPLASVYNDGQNTISLFMFNKAGMSNTQRFFITFQATPPLITMNWPLPDVVISGTKPLIEASVNLQAYANLFANKDKTFFRIYPRSTSAGPIDGGAGVAQIPFDNVATADWGKNVFILKHKWTTGSISLTGPLWLEIQLATQQVDPITHLVTSQGATEIRRIPFSIDNVPPVLSISPSNRTWNLVSNSSLRFDYSFQDPPLQVMTTSRWRIFDAANIKVFESQPLPRYSGQTSSFFWDGKNTSGISKEGLYTVTYEGFDQTVTDKTTYAQAQNLQTLATGPVNAAFETAWNGLNTKVGFNLGKAQSQVYLDLTPPSFVMDNFTALVSSANRQIIHFRIADASSILPSAQSKVTWTFTRKYLGGTEVIPVEMLPIITTSSLGNASVLTLEESLDEGGWKLNDGSYDLSVTVTDEAGNINEDKTRLWSFRVDRKAPVIDGLKTNELTFQSKSMSSNPQVLFDITEPDEDLANQETNPSAFLTRMKVTLVSPIAGAPILALIPSYSAETKFSTPLPKDLLATGKGVWTAKVEVSDAIGNKSATSHQFWVDLRPSEISYPKTSDATPTAVVEASQTVIRGLALNPALSGKLEYYELVWRPLGQTTWKTTGITVPESRRGSAGIANRSYLEQSIDGVLGYWNLSALATGSYQLGLKTHQKEENIDGLVIKEILYTPSTVLPDFTVSLKGLPASGTSFSAGSPMDLSLSIAPKGVWPVSKGDGVSAERHFRADIFLADALGQPMAEFPTQSLKASYFSGVPVNKTAAGVYLWHDGDGTWNLQTKNIADNLQFSIGYNSLEPMSFDCVAPMSCEENTIMERTMNLPQEKSVIVNRNLTILVNKGSNGLMTFKLPSRAIFSVMKLLPTDAPDGTTNLYPASTFYLGQDAKTTFSNGIAGMVVPPFALDPMPSSYNFSWNGFLQTNGFPAPGKATVKIEVVDEETGLTREAAGTILIGQTPLKLEVPTSSPTTLLFEPGSDLSRITFNYGITGQAGLITAGIKDASGKVIHLFFQDQPRQPSSNKLAYSETWNGICNQGDMNGLSVKADQTLTFFVEAKGLPTATVTLAFPVQSVNWQKGGSGYDFKVDGGTIIGDKTYIKAQPLYRLMAEAKGDYADATVVNYNVNYSGEQQGIQYESERYNLWIQRKRNTFKATVFVWFRSSEAYFRDTPWYLTCDKSSVPDFTDRFDKFEVTLNKGEEIDLNMIYGSKGKDFVFRCLGDNCQEDLLRTVSIAVLPGSIDELIPSGSYANKVAQWDRLETKALYKINNIQLFNNKIYQNGPTPNVDDPRGWTLGAGSVAYQPGDWFRNTVKVDPANPYKVEDHCKFKVDPTSHEGTPLVDDKNDGVFSSKSDKCEDNTQYDPEDNLLNYSFDFGKDNGSWPYDNKDPTTCTPDHNHIKVGFILKLKVPNEYWDAPFGYNNQANKSMRWDPKNTYLFGQGTGIFSKDGWNNRQNKKGDDPEDYFGFINPFEQASFNLLPYSKTPFLGANGIISGIPYFAIHPLSFGDEEYSQSMPNSRLEIGFNGKPNGNSSQFDLQIGRSECKGLAIECKENNSVNVLSLNSKLNQWDNGRVTLKDFQFGYSELANSTFLGSIAGALFGSASSAIVTNHSYNWFFRLTLRASLNESAAKTKSMLWPNVGALPTPVKNVLIEPYCQKLYSSVSNLHYGVGDGITNSGSYTTLLNLGGPYVRADGFFKNPSDPDFINPENEPVELSKINNASLNSGNVPLTLNPTTKILEFRDYVHFIKPTGSVSYSNIQAGVEFGKNVTVATAIPSLAPLRTEQENGNNVVVFSGGKTIPWSGKDDENMANRDLDGDGVKGEEPLNFADDDVDNFVDEDVPGALSSLLSFTPGLITENINFKQKLYEPSLTVRGKGAHALIQYSSATPSIPSINPLVSGVNLAFSVRYPDGTARDDISASIPTGNFNPMLGTINIKHNNFNWTKSKEFVALKGTVPGHYDLEYVDKDGRIQLFGSSMKKVTTERILGYLPIEKLQGRTSLFLINYLDNGKVEYRQLDVEVGTPVLPTAVTDVSSEFGEANVHFEAGVLTQTQAVTVRVTNVADAGLALRNNLSAVGPVIEVLPHQVFDPTKPLPQIFMRIPFFVLAGRDPSSIRLFKPDGDNLVELSNQQYAFYINDGTQVCVGNASGICSTFDIMQISASTPSFSHFVALEKFATQTQPFTLSVTPDRSMDPVRQVTLKGILPTALNLYIDDDSVFTEDNDVTPPQSLTTAWTKNSAGDYVTNITVPGKRVFWIQAVPNAVNSHVSTFKIERMDGFTFTNISDEKVYLGTLGGNSAYMSFASNREGSLEIFIYQGEQLMARLDRPLVSGYNYTEIKAMVGSTLLPLGTFRTAIRAQSFDGSQISIDGPQLIVDGAAPEALLSASLMGTPENLTAQIKGLMRDYGGLDYGELQVRLGADILDWQYFFDKTFELNSAIPLASLQAHCGSPLQITLSVHDFAGNITKKIVTLDLTDMTKSYCSNYLAVTPILEKTVRNCDGTFTAYFAYNNPNPSYTEIPVGDRNYFLYQGNSQVELGQGTVYLAGAHSGNFSVTFDGGDLIWHLDGNTVTASGRNLNQSCNLKDIAPILEKVTRDCSGIYHAIFGYDNCNRSVITLAPGLDNGFKYNGQTNADLGQITRFLPGHHSAAFSIAFDGTDLIWTLMGKTSKANKSRAVEQCSALPIRPFLVKVEKNCKGDYLATFGYSNPNAMAISIPAGNKNGINYNGHCNANLGQPIVFQPGRIDSAFTVTFNGGDLVWEVDCRGATAAIRNAYESCPTRQNVQPIITRVDIVQAGVFRAWFGYNNPGQLKEQFNKGTLNQFTYRGETVMDFGQPESFDPGLKTAVFSIDYDGSPLTWNLHGKSITATIPAINGTDLGNPTSKGSYSFIGDTLKLIGAGTGFKGSSDQGYYANIPFHGDGEVSFRLGTVTGSTTADIGIMLRENLTASGKALYLGVNAAGKAFLYARSAASTSPKVTQGTLPALGGKWLKLRKSGTTFTAYESVDGDEWKLVGSATVTLPVDFIAGFAISSGSTTTLATGKVSSLTLTTK